MGLENGDKERKGHKALKVGLENKEWQLHLAGHHGEKHSAENSWKETGIKALFSASIQSGGGTNDHVHKSHLATVQMQKYK